MEPAKNKDLLAVELEEIKVDDSIVQELNVNESGYYQVAQTPVHSEISYRPDIDGLRAVAITLVVVYHAYPDLLPGGFIGVDIFFVISGYLISQILIKQINKRKFSYKDFYCRRVKRIFPAFLTVLLFTVAIAAVFSNDYQVNTTINTLQASLVFSANILTLFSERGYFDPDIRSNPLLHLWSLGVEEQFYIIWPWLMFVVLKIFTRKSTLVLAGYAGLSFLLSIIAIFFSPKFAFYFPFCRFWQMAVGGILAHLNLKIKNPTITNTLSFSAILAILITTFIISEESMFPGFWALIPTFGSAFIIQAKGQALFNKHILSNKVFLFIGKISYSLYLWHWPLLVFSRTFYPRGSTSILSNTLFILVLTVALSIMTYYFVQNPVRLIKKNRVVVVLLLLAITLGTVGFALKIILPRLAPSDQSIIAMLKEAEHNMIPTAEDYIERNGRKHPNLSKNKNREKTTSQKLRIPYFDEKYDYSHFDRENLFEKDIDASSIFHRKQLPQLKHFVVANEGRENKFLLVGDSHSLKLSYRFQQLFFQSREKSQLQKFPTIVGIVRFGMLGGENDQINDFLVDFVKQHKIQRVLIANHWLPRWCKDTNTYFDESPICDIAKADSYNNYVLGVIQRLKANGAQVSVVAVDIQHPLLSPQKMADVFLQPIEANIQPFKYSDFRRKYRQVIDKWETTMKNANIPIIDIADNLCWEDVCEKFTPSGYPAYQDNNHISKFYSRHWVSVVDHLVEF